MTVKFYYLHSSQSCRQARKYLEDNEIEFVAQCMNTDPLNWEQLFEILMYTNEGVADILSLRSNDYKMLIEEGINFDELSLTEFHYVVKKHPRVLKSPIIVGKNNTMVGYNVDEISLLGTRKAKKDSFKELLNIFHIEDKKQEQEYMLEDDDSVLAI